MHEIIKQLSERLAARSSRRGFFAMMGKAALGAAAVVTGQSLFAQVAEAAPKCCTTGHATLGVCPTTSCPPGTYQHYTWFCHNDGGTRYTCHDCYSSTTQHLYCVYATKRH